MNTSLLHQLVRSDFLVGAACAPFFFVVCAVFTGNLGQAIGVSLLGCIALAFLRRGYLTTLRQRVTDGNLISWTVRLDNRPGIAGEVAVLSDPDYA